MPRIIQKIMRRNKDRPLRKKLIEILQGNIDIRFNRLLTYAQWAKKTKRMMYHQVKYHYINYKKELKTDFRAEKYNWHERYPESFNRRFE